MATKEITKRETSYPGPELEPELILAAEEAPRAAERTIAKLSLLWERRQFLFRCAAIGLVASTIIAFIIPPRYSSTTRLMPPDQAGQGMASMLAALGKASGDMGGIGGELLGLKTTGDMFVGVLHSRTVEDDLINKFDLRKVYGARRYGDARKVLDAYTDVSSDRKSGIITVVVSDLNPERAAAMGREYVEALNRIVITLNTSSAHKERVFLEERLGQVQQDLEQAEKDFSQFASKNTAIDVKEQGRAMIGAAAELEGQLIAAETELEGLRQIYTPENVRVRSLQARIQEYRRQLQKLGGSTAGSTEGGSTPTGNSGEPSQDLYPSIRQLPLLGVTWADLYRRTRVQEAVYETLTKQYELAKVEEARETPSVKVLDVADVPERKSYPPRLFFMILGTGFVFVFACAWLLADEWWQGIDPQTPGKALATGVFETIAATWPLKSKTSAKMQSIFQKVVRPSKQ
jgi:capsule polysaccharide export protein KpsE/RkpR